MLSPEATAPSAPVAEAERMLTICNACRYCEGYCALFPAMERRLTFSESDINYLANLCHNCGACLYSCQYAPPHEFALNLPRVLAETRVESYKKYAWPQSFARLYDRNGLVVSLAIAASMMLMLLLAALVVDPQRLFAAHTDAQGSFYALIPHNVMATGFGVVFAFVMVSFGVSFFRFWPHMGEDVAEFFRPRSSIPAGMDVLTLKYLDGGGDGCMYPDERPAFARKYAHQATFYGFMLCFAATTAATFYHYVLGREAPYPLLSLPVILGVAGGIGLIVGPIGLLVLKRKRDPQLTDLKQTGMDVGFLVLLLATSLTGLALLAFRETVAMGILLFAHLGFVLALFVTLPYGKFVHGLYRFAALIRFHIEARRPPPAVAPE